MVGIEKFARTSTKLMLAGVPVERPMPMSEFAKELFEDSWKGSARKTFERAHHWALKRNFVEVFGFGLLRGG